MSNDQVSVVTFIDDRYAPLEVHGAMMTSDEKWLTFADGTVVAARMVLWIQDRK